MGLVVTRARIVSHGRSLEVNFQDGHKLTVCPNQAGFSEPNEIERVILSLKQDYMAVFNSPYQYVINHRPFGFAKVKAGYSLERIAEYWQAAYDHVRSSSQGKMTEAWLTLSLASKEFEEVKTSKWPLPK